MTHWILWVGVLGCLVELLLIFTANRLAGAVPEHVGIIIGAILGGGYMAACMIRGLTFLGSFLWRLICLGVVCLFAFGWERGQLRVWGLFLLLHMALGGIVSGMGIGGSVGILAAVAALVFLCAISFYRRGQQGNLFPVELFYGSRSISLTALRDTGNTLRDPLTGQSVLVIGAEAAGKLTGLTAQQLKSPVETAAAAVLPGLRLVPFSTIGQSSGLMLALRMQKQEKNGKKVDSLVAFAPAGLDDGCEYQALTGGCA